jgi:hypothetical protein
VAGSGVSAAAEASSAAVVITGLLLMILLSHPLVRSSTLYASSISSSSFSSSLLNMLVFQMLGVGALVEVGDRTVDSVDFDIGTFEAEDEEDLGACPLMGVPDWLRRRAPDLLLLTDVLPPPTLPTSRPVN